MTALREFLAAREIWEVPLAASVVAGGVLGVLGVYGLPPRTVFLSPAPPPPSIPGRVAPPPLQGRGPNHQQHTPPPSENTQTRTRPPARRWAEGTPAAPGATPPTWWRRRGPPRHADRSGAAT